MCLLLLAALVVPLLTVVLKLALPAEDPAAAAGRRAAAALTAACQADASRPWWDANASNPEAPGTDAEPAALRCAASAAGTARPVLTMYVNGGLGNQLFQVAALLAVAEELDCRVSVALAELQRVPSMGVADARPSYWHSALRRLRPLLVEPEMLGRPPQECTAFEAWSWPGGLACFGGDGLLALGPEAAAGELPKLLVEGLLQIGMQEACRASGLLGLQGDFQLQGFFLQHLPRIRGALWDEGLAQAALGALAEVLPEDATPNVVSVHYRFGDFELHPGYLIEESYYERALGLAQQRLGPELTCVVFSDEPERVRQRGAGLGACRALAFVPGEVDDVTSFYMMAIIPNNVITDSTFSYWAALLGPGKSLVLFPALDDWKFRHWQAQDGVCGWTAVPAELEF